MLGLFVWSCSWILGFLGRFILSVCLMKPKASGSGPGREKTQGGKGG